MTNETAELAQKRAEAAAAASNHVDAARWHLTAADAWRDARRPTRQARSLTRAALHVHAEGHVALSEHLADEALVALAVSGLPSVSSAPAHVARGVARASLGRWDEAVADWERALILHLEDLDAPASRGLAALVLAHGDELGADVSALWRRREEVLARALEPDVSPWWEGTSIGELLGAITDPGEPLPAEVLTRWGAVAECLHTQTCAEIGHRMYVAMPPDQRELIDSLMGVDDALAEREIDAWVNSGESDNRGVVERVISEHLACALLIHEAGKSGVDTAQ